MYAAAFNLQALAPECAMEWTVTEKWFLVQSLPFVVMVACGGTALVVGAVQFVVQERLRRGNRWGIAVRHLTGVQSAATLNDTLFGIFFAGL